MVAITGIVNAVSGLFPQVGVELAEITRLGPRSGFVLTGRVAAVELGIALLVLALFLARGSRQAWWLAVLLTTVGTLLSVLRGHLSIAVVLSALALVLLLATRSTFRLRGSGARPVRWSVPIAMAVGLFAFAVVGYAEIDGLASAPLADQLAVIWRTLLFLPGGVNIEQTLVEAYELALHVGSVLLVLAVIWALRSGHHGHPEDRDGVRSFAYHHGTTGTAPLLALPDNQLLELDSGRAWAAVGIRGGTAVSLGAPVAEAGRESAALNDFTSHCEQNGWTPALLALDSAQNELAVAAGYATMQIGVEAVLDVAEFSTAGKRRSNIRHSCSRARREDVTVLSYSGPARSAERTEQLAEVSAQWLQDKGGPELGFTLGRFDPERLDDQEIYVAVHGVGSAAERVVAFVTWLPFNNGQDAVLDLMRRAQDCPPGVMELLIVESVAHFASLGRARASLGGVPLAHDPKTSADVDKARARRVLGWLYEHGGEVYDARGLFRFKDKFAPRWEPMFLAYPGRADLPRISLGIARAFLPPGAVRQAIRTRRSNAANVATADNAAKVA